MFSAPNIGGLGGGLVLLTSEASVKHVLKDNFENYTKPENDIFWDILRPSAWFC